MCVLVTERPGEGPFSVSLCLSLSLSLCLSFSLYLSVSLCLSLGYIYTASHLSPLGTSPTFEGLCVNEHLPHRYQLDAVRITRRRNRCEDTNAHHACTHQPIPASRHTLLDMVRFAKSKLLATIYNPQSMTARPLPHRTLAPPPTRTLRPHTHQPRLHGRNLLRQVTRELHEDAWTRGRGRWNTHVCECVWVGVSSCVEYRGRVEYRRQGTWRQEGGRLHCRYGVVPSWLAKTNFRFACAMRGELASESPFKVWYALKYI